MKMLMKMRKTNTVTESLRYKNVAAGLAGVILLAVLYYLAVQNLLLLEPCRNTAVILLETNPMTRKEVLAVLEAEKEQENPYTFAAWTQQEEVSIQNRELNRSCMAAAVQICGRSDILVKGSTWIDEEDTDGCLIDEKTAEQLFGSTAIVGMKITIDGQEKTVRGILYGVSDVVVCEADDLTMLTALQVAMDSEIRYEEIRQEFMMRNSITGRFLKMDILYQTGTLLALLIPFCTGWSILWFIWKRAWGLRAQSEGMLYGALAALGTFFLFYFLIAKLEIPRDIIPTKWSDFDFWKTWWEKESESLQLLLLTEKQKPQQKYFSAFSLITICSILGITGKHVLIKLFKI